jgi:hypothetical protein
VPLLFDSTPFDVARDLTACRSACKIGSDSHPMKFSAELAVLQRGNQRHASRYSNFVAYTEWFGYRERCAPAWSRAWRGRAAMSPACRLKTLRLLASQSSFCASSPKHLGASARLPTMHGFGEAVEAGCLMSYAPNIRDLYRRAAPCAVAATSPMRRLERLDYRPAFPLEPPCCGALVSL